MAAAAPLGSRSLTRRRLSACASITWVTCWFWASSEQDGCTNGANPQQSWVLDRNVSVSDGALHMKAVREQHTVGDKTYEWTSGMVTTGRIGNAAPTSRPSSTSRTVT
ncbi:hypothetical protein [Streptomyces sp. CB03238]|uniref:hypothetical protein n=1 Tax=Streptomyces sp. CB03238 TaxID=1907777 RepID=UPI0015C432EC|nr:hypothetical protein [Streptomyces sp. CB03238]